MISKQAWIYHGKSPKAGRKLLLLEQDELTFALPLIYRIIHPKEIPLRNEWFSSEIIELDERENSQYVLLVERLQQATVDRKKSNALENSLVQLNRQLNLYFSDHGWRMVRKELSQIKKRQKKSHIELSNDLIAKLKIYMEQEHFDSFDQAIDNLLTESASIKLEDKS